MSKLEILVFGILGMISSIFLFIQLIAWIGHIYYSIQRKIVGRTKFWIHPDYKENYDLLQELEQTAILRIIKTSFWGVLLYSLYYLAFIY